MWVGIRQPNSDGLQAEDGHWTFTDHVPTLLPDRVRAEAELMRLENTHSRLHLFAPLLVERQSGIEWKGT